MGRRLRDSRCPNKDNRFERTRTNRAPSQLGCKIESSFAITARDSAKKLVLEKEAAKEKNLWAARV